MLSVDEVARQLRITPGRVRWYVTFLETEGVLQPRRSNAQPIRLGETDLAILRAFIEALNQGMEPEEAASTLRRRPIVAGLQPGTVEAVAFVPPLPEVNVPDEFDSQALRELAQALQTVIRHHLPQLLVAIQAVDQTVAEHLDRLADELRAIRARLAAKNNGPLL